MITFFDNQIRPLSKDLDKKLGIKHIKVTYNDKPQVISITFNKPLAINLAFLRPEHSEDRDFEDLSDFYREEQ